MAAVLDREDVLQRLRGVFALIIWDSLRNTLLCVRDPLGIHPMFYADSGHTLFVSPSIDVLIRQPHVSAIVNRAALADYQRDHGLYTTSAIDEPTLASLGFV